MHEARCGVRAVAAILFCSGLALAQAGPAPESNPPPGSPAPKLAKETGFTESGAQVSIKKAIPGIEFSAPASGDGRRRVFGTIAKAKMPTIELLGAPDDLSQVTALSPLATPLGAAAVETSPFAIAVLDFAAPDWPERRAWLKAALKKVEETKGDHQVTETRGRLQVTFAAWQRMGMFRVTVETVDGAAMRAAQTSRTGLPLPKPEGSTNAAKPDAPKPEAGKPETPVPHGAPPKTETKADGTTLVDGKYTLKGARTEADPDKVGWDQLVSAQDDYVPKDGRKEIPGRVSMLDGKWVDIVGYVAFPLMVDTPDECLSMMNQWDGCCIGIPPTPYDAIEVRLTKAVEGNARMTTYGGVRGHFKVDPHLVGGWLVGLYTMDQATLTPQSYGGFAP